MNILFIVCGFELEIESQMETYAEGFELGVYVIKLAVFVGRVGAGPQFHLACAQDDTVAHAVVFAESHNDAYNRADQEAVEMAKALPKQFSQPVVDAYASATADLVSRYDSLRSDAASNDAYLREYLGQD